MPYLKGRKVFNFDVETTGLFPNIHGIVQLSGIIEINDEAVDRFNFLMKPFPQDKITEESLKVHGHTLDKIVHYQKPEQIYDNLIEIMKEHVDPFDPNDKFYPCGYNIGFDTSFLIQFFKKNGDEYIGSWLNMYVQIDPLPVLRMLDFMGKFALPNYRLETVAEVLGIEHNPHDAMSDIEVTIEIRKAVETLIDC